LVRLVLRLSALAKAGAGLALLGAVVAVYGELKRVGWAEDWGRGLLFGGFLIYVIERARMIMKQRRVPRDGE